MIETLSENAFERQIVMRSKEYRPAAMTAHVTINWLRWLDDDDVDFVRVLSFDFSKLFDTVPHKIVCEKLKSTYLNPHIINWIISFLGNRKQRVVVNGKVTSYVDINRGGHSVQSLGHFYSL